MALIKCSECGKEFSDKANACPNCACPVEKEKIKVKIYNKGGFTTKCSVSIDNLPVGQLGGMMLGKQKDIEISLPIGTHYIGVSTQIEHGGQITGVVGVGQEQDGKQFEITTNDKYLEIEIVAKGSFTGTSGRYCVGNIKHYNSKELKTLKEQEQNVEKEKEQKKKKKKDFFNKNKKTFIIILISLIAIITLYKIITLVNENNKYYGTYSTDSYEPYKRADDMNATLILKPNMCEFYIIEDDMKVNYNCSYIRLDKKREILEVEVESKNYSDQIFCGRFTEHENSKKADWSCKTKYDGLVFFEKLENNTREDNTNTNNQNATKKNNNVSTNITTISYDDYKKLLYNTDTFVLIVVNDYKYSYNYKDALTKVVNNYKTPFYYYEIDIDNNVLNVEGCPTTLIIKNGKVVDSFEGFIENETLNILNDKLNKLGLK